MVEGKRRFWFYAGALASTRAQAKAAAIVGAKWMTREQAKKSRVPIPKSAWANDDEWTHVVIGHAESEADSEE